MPPCIFADPDCSLDNGRGRVTGRAGQLAMIEAAAPASSSPARKLPQAQNGKKALIDERLQVESKALCEILPRRARAQGGEHGPVGSGGVREGYRKPMLSHGKAAITTIAAASAAR